MSTWSSSTTTTTLLTAMKYLAYTLLTFSKSFSRQTVWGRYIHELIHEVVHFETFYKDNNRDLQHLELILQFLIIFFESLLMLSGIYSRWPNLTSSQERGKHTCAPCTHTCKATQCPLSFS